MFTTSYLLLTIYSLLFTPYNLLLTIYSFPLLTNSRTLLQFKCLLLPIYYLLFTPYYLLLSSTHELTYPFTVQMFTTSYLLLTIYSFPVLTNSRTLLQFKWAPRIPVYAQFSVARYIIFRSLLTLVRALQTLSTWARGIWKLSPPPPMSRRWGACICVCYFIWYLYYIIFLPSTEISFTSCWDHFENFVKFIWYNTNTIRNTIMEDEYFPCA